MNYTFNAYPSLTHTHKVAQTQTPTFPPTGRSTCIHINAHAHTHSHLLKQILTLPTYTVTLPALTRSLTLPTHADTHYNMDTHTP